MFDLLGGPFNGQTHRRRMFTEIVELLGIAGIIETGAHLGSTTELFARTGLEVHSVEIHQPWVRFTRKRLERKGLQAHVHHGDSRAVLAALARDGVLTDRPTLFYLDAHWDEDLPLREEVELVFAHWRQPVVMIDDFEVPGTDYGFDDYGAGRRLTLRYLGEPSDHGARGFYPSVDAEDETGWRRGAIVLVRQGPGAETLAEAETLRQA